jgi:hypothetical protein
MELNAYGPWPTYFKRRSRDQKVGIGMSKEQKQEDVYLAMQPVEYTAEPGA